MNSGVLVGRYDVAVDESGMFVLPDEWRSLLVENGEICLMRDMHNKCLILLAKSTLDSEIDALKSIPNDFRACETLRTITDNMELIRVDEAARIRVSNGMREFAGIGKGASLQGGIRFVKIWSPVALDAKSEKD